MWFATKNHQLVLRNSSLPQCVTPSFATPLYTEPWCMIFTPLVLEFPTDGLHICIPIFKKKNPPNRLQALDDRQCSTYRHHKWYATSPPLSEQLCRPGESSYSWSPTSRNIGVGERTHIKRENNMTGSNRHTSLWKGFVAGVERLD